MRSTLARLATPAKYLASGNPTGLTGVLTHPSPRSELIALYTGTLFKLSKLPAHSSYRNATESLTKHRLAHVESLKPAGWDEWKTKADSLLQQYPNLFKVLHPLKRYIRHEVDGKPIISEKLVSQIDEDDLEYGGQKLPVYKEGLGGTEKLMGDALKSQEIAEFQQGESEWVPEPKLDAEQISQLEEKIGAGLIEEVIDVARGEFQLVSTMLEAQVWEELEEKPAPGQWQYFQRDRNNSDTQEPPKV